MSRFWTLLVIWIALAGYGAEEAPAIPRLLSRALLDESLELGTRYLLMNQTPAGNFVYSYDIERHAPTADDNAVRQAGALWGLALIHRDRPALLTERALRSGLAFWADNSTHRPELGRYPIYPQTRLGDTNTVALLVLTHVDLLAAAGQLEPLEIETYERYVQQYVQFLLSLRREDGLFHPNYAYTTGQGFGEPSPYADGEALLALVKVARQANRPDLQAAILASAEAMHQRHVVDALKADPDSDLTKGYFQWAILAYHELVLSGWPETAKYAARAIELAEWMIVVHRILERSRNTAYAFEGIITAAELARLTGRADFHRRFQAVVDSGLYRLTTWQVGSAIENGYLTGRKAREPMAMGGVLNAADEPLLRIDVTQHQMHAVLLARRYLYKE